MSNRVLEAVDQIDTAYFEARQKLSERGVSDARVRQELLEKTKAPYGELHSSQRERILEAFSVRLQQATGYSLKTDIIKNSVARKTLGVGVIVPSGGQGLRQHIDLMRTSLGDARRAFV